MQIEQLPGVEPCHAQRLKEAGIRTCEQLLLVARYSDRLADLAGAARLSVSVLGVLVQRAELSQLQGIGPANLASLAEAGILTLSALAAEEPEGLRLRLRQVAPHPPNLAVVEHWIAQARRRGKKPGQEATPAPGSC